MLRVVTVRKLLMYSLLSGVIFVLHDKIRIFLTSDRIIFFSWDIMFVRGKKLKSTFSFTIVSLLDVVVCQ